MKTIQFIPFILISILLEINCMLPKRNSINAYNFNQAATDYVYKDDLYRLQYAIQNGASIEERDPFMNNYTPLMIACREGNYQIAKWLVSNGANVNAKTRDGHTPLMMAAYNRYPNIVKLLLENGADVHQVSEQGHTALSEVTLEDTKIIEKELRNAIAK